MSLGNVEAGYDVPSDFNVIIVTPAGGSGLMAERRRRRQMRRFSQA